MLMISQAETVARMASSISPRGDLPFKSSRTLLPPKRSSARRSSGWNMMTRAMTPSSRILLRPKWSISICSTPVIHVASNSATMALATRAVLVECTILTTLYMRKATIRISRISFSLMPRKA